MNTHTDTRSEDLVDLGAISETTKGAPKGDAPDLIPQNYQVGGFLTND